MNRTKEFGKIVQATNFPQKQCKEINKDIKNLFDLDLLIQSEVSSLYETIIGGKVYETFRIQLRIDEVKEKIYKLKKMLDIEIHSTNQQEYESFQSLSNILRTRANKHALKLNETIRRRDERQQSKVVIPTTEDIHKPINNTNLQSLNAVALEQHDEQTSNVRYREREAITNQISEIGEIMEEIGIHVSMQEESFKRIDELMIQTDGVFDTSLSLLRKTLDNIKGVRSTIVKFFLFWLVLAVLFWLLRLGR